MSETLNIENIEEMRLQEGIDDVPLRQAIRELDVGAHVKLTFLTGDKAGTGETLAVRVTSIRGFTFRGKLADKPVLAGLAKLRVGAAIVFTAAQIHSIEDMRGHKSRRKVKMQTP